MPADAVFIVEGADACIRAVEREIEKGCKCMHAIKFVEGANAWIRAVDRVLGFGLRVEGLDSGCRTMRSSSLRVQMHPFVRSCVRVDHTCQSHTSQFTVPTPQSGAISLPES